MVHISNPDTPDAVLVIGGYANSVSLFVVGDCSGVVDLHDCAVRRGVDIGKLSGCANRCGDEAVEV